MPRTDSLLLQKASLFQILPDVAISIIGNEIGFHYKKINASFVGSWGLKVYVAFIIYNYFYFDVSSYMLFVILKFKLINDQISGAKNYLAAFALLVNRRNT